MFPIISSDKAPNRHMPGANSESYKTNGNLPVLWPKSSIDMQKRSLKASERWLNNLEQKVDGATTLYWRELSKTLVYDDSDPQW